MGFIDEKIVEIRQRREELIASVEELDGILEILGPFSGGSWKEEKVKILSTTTPASKKNSQTQILEALSDGAARSTAELGKLTGSKNVGRTAKTLEKKGLVVLKKQGRTLHVQLKGGRKGKVQTAVAA